MSKKQKMKAAGYQPVHIKEDFSKFNKYNWSNAQRDARYLCNKSTNTSEVEKTMYYLLNNKGWMYNQDRDCGLSAEKILTLAVVTGFVIAGATAEVGYAIDHNKDSFHVEPKHIVDGVFHYNDKVVPIKEKVEIQYENNGTVIAINQGHIDGKWFNDLSNKTENNTAYIELNLSGLHFSGSAKNLTIDALFTDDAGFSANFDGNVTNGTADGILKDVKINGTATGNVTDLHGTGVFKESKITNGTANGYVKNFHINGTSNGTIDLTKFDGKVTGLVDLDLTGNYTGKLDAATISGNISMTYKQLKDFLKNSTIKGNGTIYYGNGQVPISLEAVLNLTGINDTDKFTMKLENAVVSATNMTGSFKDARVKGEVDLDLTNVTASGTYKGFWDGWGTGDITLENINATISGYADIWLNGTVNLALKNVIATGKVAFENLTADIKGALRNVTMRGGIHGTATNGTVDLTAAEGSTVKGYVILPQISGDITNGTVAFNMPKSYVPTSDSETPVTHEIGIISTVTGIGTSILAGLGLTGIKRRRQDEKINRGYKRNAETKAAAPAPVITIDNKNKGAFELAKKIDYASKEPIRKQVERLKKEKEEKAEA
jgi:hypothetical protein